MEIPRIDKVIVSYRTYKAMGEGCWVGVDAIPKVVFFLGFWKNSLGEKVLL